MNRDCQKGRRGLNTLPPAEKRFAPAAATQKSHFGSISSLGRNRSCRGTPAAGMKMLVFCPGNITSARELALHCPSPFACKGLKCPGKKGLVDALNSGELWIPGTCRGLRRRGVKSGIKRVRSGKKWGRGFSVTSRTITFKPGSAGGSEVCPLDAGQCREIPGPYPCPRVPPLRATCPFFNGGSARPPHPSSTLRVTVCRSLPANILPNTKYEG